MKDEEFKQFCSDLNIQLLPWQKTILAAMIDPRFKINLSNRRLVDNFEWQQEYLGKFVNENPQLEKE